MHEAKFDIGGVDPTPENLGKIYLPDEFISQIAKTSTNYAQARLQKKETITVEIGTSPPKTVTKTKTTNPPDITESDVLNFCGILLYMGLVKLPAKEDYWSTDPDMPSHPMIESTGMSYKKFHYLWRNIHLGKHKKLSSLHKNQNFHFVPLKTLLVVVLKKHAFDGAFFHEKKQKQPPCAKTNKTHRFSHTLANFLEFFGIFWNLLPFWRCQNS